MIKNHEVPEESVTKENFNQQIITIINKISRRWLDVQEESEVYDVIAEGIKEFLPGVLLVV
ncbi:MAG: hypothetical protein ACP5D6_09400 [Kosmotogaceae bacterium]